MNADDILAPSKVGSPDPTPDRPAGQIATSARNDGRTGGSDSGLGEHVADPGDRESVRRVCADLLVRAARLVRAEYYYDSTTNCAQVPLARMQVLLRALLVAEGRGTAGDAEWTERRLADLGESGERATDIGKDPHPYEDGDDGCLVCGEGFMHYLHAEDHEAQETSR